MKKLTNESSYLRMSKALISENVKVLVDKNGSFSQKEAFEVYCGLVNELKELIKKGNVCLIAPFARKETILIVLAVVSLGGVVMVGNHHASLASFLEQIETKTKIDVFISFENDKWVATRKDKSVALSLERQDIEVVPSKTASRVRPSFYFLTSGSTGTSKIVALSEYSFINHITREIDDIGKDHTMSYGCLPLNHIFGLALYIQHLLCGKSVYISDSRNPSLALDVIEKMGCSAVANVPTFFYMLIDEQKKKPRNISSLSYGVIAGGGYSEEQFLNIEQELGITLCSSYGMSEASTVITNATCDIPTSERCKGVGKPFPNVDVVLKDDNGNIDKKRGEICFKGYNLMLGYVEGDKLSLPLDDNGYFHTGDIGEMDEEGIYRIIGRKKNIIIRGGENLSPSEIAQKIARIDGIKDAVVVGVDNEKYGEVVGAYIATEKYNKEELLSIFKNTLPKNEVPQFFVIDDKIPLLNNGKHDILAIKAILENLDEKL